MTSAYRLRRRLRRLVLAAALTLAAAHLPLAGAARVSEDDVKLVLLYKIARFVTWPEAQLEAERLRLCIAGKDTFEAARRKLDARELGGRRIEPTLLESPQSVTACDVLYVPAQYGARSGELLAALREQPVLTVSDATQFAREGGVVELATRNNRVQIVINVAASRRSGLVISSQLLELATLVDDKESGS